MGEAGFDGEPQLPKLNDITFSDECYGSNMAAEYSGNDIGAGTIKFGDLAFGPGNQNHGGQAIIELQSPDGGLSQVAIVTAGKDLDISDPDYGESGTPERGALGSIEAEWEAAGDSSVATYIVAPNGTVLRRNEGTMVPDPVTIGSPYKLFDDLGARAGQPGVEGSEKFAGFKDLGRVNRVLVDRRKSTTHTGDPAGNQKNPFSEKIKDVRRDIKERAAKIL